MNLNIRNCKIIELLTSLAFIIAFSSTAKQVITLSPSTSPTIVDMTPILRAKLDKIDDSDIKIVFAKGQYKFLPDYATQRYSQITNHGNGIKNVIFALDKFSSVEIEGNGSEFIFHGQTAPFQLYHNKKITISNLIIDWDIPFTFVSEIIAINKAQGWRDVKPFTGSHNWKLKNGQILFPDIDGFNYPILGSNLEFEAETKRVAHGAWDRHSHPTKVEQKANGILRIHEKLKHYPAVGTLNTSKGDRANDRYAPAFQVKNSKNVTFNNIVIHHALGMGFLFERTENITIINSGVYLRDGAPRVISSTADATHFASCKGDILIENSRFENMLDDGTNVHGTYTIIDKIIDKHSLRVKFGHFEQMGFEFAKPEDDIWFIKQPTTHRTVANTVANVRVINEKYTDIVFKNPLDEDLKAGDLLENKTWNPTFTMRGSTVRDHRARNIVLKTPLKTVIENNHFSSMMSSIFFRGESHFWYESGAVEDVVIRHNTFDYFAYSGMDHALLSITPRLGKAYNQDEIYDRNIRFENNTINTFDSRIIWADRVDGLTIKNNLIYQSIDKPAIYPNTPLFEFKNSKHITLENNQFNGPTKKLMVIDEVSKATLRYDNSIH
ncbi:MAG: alpha-1,3-galactosidase-related protein [Thalassotalea sp.]